jgi:hypothetical protein
VEGNLSASIGDGISLLAIAGGIVGYFYVKTRARQKTLEIIHQERMAAMEKGIPLPEFPPDPSERRNRPEPPVLSILGIFLSCLSLGAMTVLYLVLPAPSHIFWISPLPFVFLGVGLVTFHFSKANPYR